MSAYIEGKSEDYRKNELFLNKALAEHARVEAALTTAHDRRETATGHYSRFMATISEHVNGRRLANAQVEIDYCRTLPQPSYVLEQPDLYIEIAS
jgi:hypothetical protein